VSFHFGRTPRTDRYILGFTMVDLKPSLRKICTVGISTSRINLQMSILNLDPSNKQQMRSCALGRILLPVVLCDFDWSSPLRLEMNGQCNALLTLQFEIPHRTDSRQS
jgi:hypothetical protein